jgi:hypothetical protein
MSIGRARAMSAAIFHEPFSHATEVDDWVSITRRSVRFTLASTVNERSIGLILSGLLRRSSRLFSRGCGALAS